MLISQRRRVILAGTAAPRRTPPYSWSSSRDMPSLPKFLGRLLICSHAGTDASADSAYWRAVYVQSMCMAMYKAGRHGWDLLSNTDEKGSDED